MFDIDGEVVHIEAECVDFSEWLDFEEKIDINSVGGWMITEVAYHLALSAQ